jgi:plasmid stabilization system protein ParE
MAYKVLVTSYAEIDIDEAISWYNKIEESLASRLVEELFTVFGLISINPEIFRTRHKNLRLVNLDVFPYQVVYRVHNETIEIIAVFHSKRNPKIWKHRK